MKRSMTLDIHISNNNNIYIHDVTEVETGTKNIAIHHEKLQWILIEPDTKVFIYSHLEKPMGKVTKTEGILDALSPVLIQKR